MKTTHDQEFGLRALLCLWCSVRFLLFDRNVPISLQQQRHTKHEIQPAAFYFSGTFYSVAAVYVRCSVRPNGVCMVLFSHCTSSIIHLEVTLRWFEPFSSVSKLNNHIAVQMHINALVSECISVLTVAAFSQFWLKFISKSSRLLVQAVLFSSVRN